ncbi:sulfotransferase family protein [Psychroserpens sp. BH13MA-6]
MKPNFFIVGAAKAGTTSLYHYLSQHEEVFCPNVKEPNYYASVSAEKASVYEEPKAGNFYHRKVINNYNTYLSLYEDAKKEPILLDSSPSYLWDKNAAAHIYKDNPKAKILIVLRNPVERAFSHYLMDVRSGIQAEMDFKKALEKDCKHQPYTWGNAHLYVGLGLYHDQVKRYLDMFGPSQVKVMIYEDLFSNLESGLKDILNFIEVDTNVDINIHQAHNTFFMPKNKIYRKLIQYKSHLKVYSNRLPENVKKRLKKSMFEDSTKPSLSQETYEAIFKYFNEDHLKTKQLLLKEFQLDVNYDIVPKV